MDGWDSDLETQLREILDPQDMAKITPRKKRYYAARVDGDGGQVPCRADDCEGAAAERNQGFCARCRQGWWPSEDKTTPGSLLLSPGFARTKSRKQLCGCTLRTKEETTFSKCHQIGYFGAGQGFAFPNDAKRRSQWHMAVGISGPQRALIDAHPSRYRLAYWHFPKAQRRWDAEKHAWFLLDTGVWKDNEGKQWDGPMPKNLIPDAIAELQAATAPETRGPRELAPTLRWTVDPTMPNSGRVGALVDTLQVTKAALEQAQVAQYSSAVSASSDAAAHAAKLREVMKASDLTTSSTIINIRSNMCKNLSHVPIMIWHVA